MGEIEISELMSLRDPSLTDRLAGKAVDCGLYDLESPWLKSLENYPYYAAIARILKPVSVLEAGVYHGYSLMAFLDGHPEIREIVGLDDESCAAGSQSSAEENLRTGSGYIGKLFLPKGDVLDGFSDLGDSLFDLVHLDASDQCDEVKFQIAEGWRCLKPGGVLLVDLAGVPSVWKAIQEMRDSLGSGEGIYVDTLKGWWLGTKLIVPEPVILESSPQ